MIGINFDTLLRTEVFISRISSALGDFRRLFTDYLAPFAYAEIDDIFETEGRGSWAAVDPIYAARKAVSHPGKGILEREGTYRNAATHPNHPGSLVEVSQTELVLGVRGTYFESTFGANYPGLHEAGNDDQNLSARPVYELIAAGERFEQRMGQLGEKWSREEIRKITPSR
ncbi:hypothetical protein F4X10_06610 [Candidatus Poribacteria bacterium]|nr:hypothetical protein [Candidatus Poribacteria bacterium]MYC75425.1 hypothetical protein [Candidatus Poribacteria bacterium]